MCLEPEFTHDTARLQLKTGWIVTVEHAIYSLTTVEMGERKDHWELEVITSISNENLSASKSQFSP